jgi:pimeloyl-ACP methyl ester carboxylesterase
MSISASISMERSFVDTRSGRVAYLDHGDGPTALFVHGVFFNANMWRHQINALGDVRRIVAVDLLAHGESPVPHNEQLDVVTQSAMIVDFMDALGLNDVDLVGNDSGGAIAQLVVATAPERIRTLTLTNCDTHDNWPPVAFLPLVELARAGLLAGVLVTLGLDTARASLASGFEDPKFLSDDEIDGFFNAFRNFPLHAAALQAYVAGMDNAVTVAVEPQLRSFQRPVLIVWATNDEFFDVKWAYWLAATFPGALPVIELEGAKLFFPMERADALNAALRQFWTS